jgi:hypothetical protein
MMDSTTDLGALGFQMPTPAFLAGLILFSVIGFAAYRYGRKSEHPPARWIGLALMLYSYAVSQTWLLYAVGAALCLGLYLTRRD